MTYHYNLGLFEGKQSRETYPSIEDHRDRMQEELGKEGSVKEEVLLRVWIL